MRRDFTTRRRAILGALILLLCADVALAVYSWQLSAAPQISREQSARQGLQLKLLQKNIEEAQKIKDEMPNTQSECDKFEHSLLPASTGYSSVSSELGAIAKKSGVRLEALSFKPTAIPERKMTEMAIESTINGDYRSAIEFLNGLQRSANIYEVESLSLATEKSPQGPANVIKLELHLKTYFRTAA
jgi:type IV pilus assembly PilO-like protein